VLLKIALAVQNQAAETDKILTKIAAQVPGMVYQYVRMPNGTSRFPTLLWESNPFTVSLLRKPRWMHAP
jgi:hypothetical protein